MRNETIFKRVFAARGKVSFVSFILRIARELKKKIIFIQVSKVYFKHLAISEDNC